jgi:hypothetical protein
MGGSPEEDRALAGLGLGAPGLQTVFLHACGASTSALAGIIPTLRGGLPSAFNNGRTCGGLRTIPVKASILAAAAEPRPRSSSDGGAERCGADAARRV